MQSAAGRRAITVHIKHPEHTHTEREAILVIQTNFSCFRPYILFPQGEVVFQLLCYYKDYYQQIDPLRSVWAK